MKGKVDLWCGVGELKGGFEGKERKGQVKGGEEGRKGNVEGREENGKEWFK